MNYAKAAQIAALFQSVTSDQGEVRGSITVDDRTNSIIAYQTQDKLDELRRVVAQLDIPVRQVMIEARIVEANVDYSKIRRALGAGPVSRSEWSDGRHRQCECWCRRTSFVDLGASGATATWYRLVSNHAILDLQLSAMEKPVTVKWFHNLKW